MAVKRSKTLRQKRSVFHLHDRAIFAPMAKKLVVGNWKMYVEDRESARKFALELRRKARGISGVEIFVAPPALFLPEVEEVFRSSPIKVGAQTLSAYAEGAHTGDVSAAMFKDAGANFSIIGHSERRAWGDTNDLVRGQLECALSANLTAILCVGERERDKEGEHFDFIEKQITSAIKSFPYKLSKLIIAYEPVWAIGKRSDEAMKPQDLQEMSIFIKKVLTDILGRPAALRIPILYGGSVDETNVASLLEEGGVSGFLVGRASADSASFLEIINLCKGK